MGGVFTECVSFSRPEGGYGNDEDVIFMLPMVNGKVLLKSTILRSTAKITREIEYWYWIDIDNKEIGTEKK